MSIITELPPAAHANAGDDGIAHLSPQGAPQTPVPASLLVPLAEYNLGQGMTPDWVRSRWPEMADAMTAIEAPEAAQFGLPSLRQSM
jgi:hypothetical protein